MSIRLMIPFFYAGRIYVAGLCLLLGLMSSFIPASAVGEVQPQSLFNRGNYLMEEQDYTGALSHFHEIEEHGYRSGALFYNMGISYVYLDSLGQASYYFQRSAAYRNMGDRADAGLAYIEDRMRSSGTFIPYLSWFAFTDRLLFGMNHTMWIFTGIFLLNAGVLILITGWLFRPNRWIVRGGAATILTGLLLLIFAVSVYVWSQNYRQGVVVEPRVPLLPEPARSPDEEEESDLAYEAYTVTLDMKMSRSHAGWAYVRLRNGVTGWIPESALRLL